MKIEGYNQEHYDKLKEGVEPWNEWRKQNPNIRPNLKKAGLKKTRLWRADLRGVILTGADLSEAILTGADLRGADLRGAILKKALLWKADLREVALWRADLQEAYLHRANLTGTNLEGANNLTVGQICEAKTLYRAKLGVELEKQTKEKCPDKLKQ